MPRAGGPNRSRVPVRRRLLRGPQRLPTRPGQAGRAVKFRLAIGQDAARDALDRAHAHVMALDQDTQRHARAVQLQRAARRCFHTRDYAAAILAASKVLET